MNKSKIKPYADLRRSDLRGADLCGADLRRAALCVADLCGADLREANLYEADLCEANLYGADLHEANLRRADLCGADLRGANLRGADLHEANLRRAALCGAVLCGANLREADLREANLCGADLRGADLGGANLRGANLQDAQLPDFQTCPETGAFDAWKKLKNNHIAKIRIPAKAKRTSNLTSRKCRAEYVKVLWIKNSAGEQIAGPVKNWSNNLEHNTIYQTGKIVCADKYNDDIRLECTSGIHFFLTRSEAEGL